MSLTCVECHKKNSACSGNMSLFTICVCYKAYLLKDLIVKTSFAKYFQPLGTHHWKCQSAKKKRTFDTTYLGSLWIYWRLIFYLSANKTSSLFRDSCQDTQPIQPIFGRLFCLCTTGPQKRVDVLFAHG